MSGDQLDLAAIEARMAEWQHILDTGRYDEDLVGELAGYVWPLVAEVRRLRAAVERVEAHTATAARSYPGNAIEYGGMVHYVDDDHKTHHPDVTCPRSPTPIWTPRP